MDYTDEDIISSRKRVVRHITLLTVEPTKKSRTIWQEVKTVIKLDCETHEEGKPTSHKTRYYVSSLVATEATPAIWLKVRLKRWGVESAHQILDTTFAEDKRPWITSDAQGTLAVMLLRRIAYTILALFKFVATRNEDKHDEPWRVLMERIKDVLKWATDELFQGLRPRTFAVPSALA